MHDATQKLNPPPSGGHVLAPIFGGLLILMFLAFVITWIIPQLTWLLGPQPESQDHWMRDILPLHIYWLVIPSYLVSGIGLLLHRRWGYWLAIAGVVFWLAMRTYNVVAPILKGLSQSGFIFTANLGVNLPPTFNSLTILYINLVCICALVFLHRPSVMIALGIQPKLMRNAIILGIALTAYAIFCDQITEVLAPVEPIYFQF
jgi:hypothetical protein